MTRPFIAAALAATLLGGALLTPVAAQSMAGHAAPAMPAGPVVTLGDLTLAGPFTRATLPAAKSGGGFLAITNNGTVADRLLSAASDAAEMVQLHEMKMEGDKMLMAEKAAGIEIPAGETVLLAPGGLHIMFMGLRAPFVEGTKVPVKLTFELAGTIDIELAVMAVGAASAGH
ncbi:copper chaperone PCu(A)C [Devosia sp.]|uniref:copper chaperone PCu(A)C n=1 Tax=Devosia sp. TaxID=1871048 RepID=UPI002EF76892